MKANELMLGDWVQYRSRPFVVTGFSVRSFWLTALQSEDLNVREFLGNSAYNVEGVGPSLDKAKMIYNPDDTEIEPVPLTPEILEKNGFDIAFHHAEIRYGLYWDINTQEIYTNEGYENATICKIRYVHELQHALRMLGISQEIEL